jgi:hypothetical protein
MKKVLLLAAAATCAVASAANAATIYVGSFQVDDGPSWPTNPAVYSATEAAALLFGGVASDYDVSTISSNIADINNMGWYSTWGIFGGQQYNEDFKLDLGGVGYNDPGGPNTAISAYVRDNAIGSQFTNFVFRVDSVAAVPEPASWALMIAGFGLVGSAMRRRKPSVSVSFA